MLYKLEFLKFFENLNYLPQNLQNISPNLIGRFYLHEKNLLALLFHLYSVCSGLNIMPSMLSIFFSISFIVWFHIASSASSSFRREFMLPNVPLISLILPFIMSKTSKISLYSSTFTNTGIPLCSFILLTYQKFLIILGVTRNFRFYHP